MSQRKQNYSLQEMIERLNQMDSQIIHGTDFFKQVSDQLSQLSADLEKAVEAVSAAYQTLCGVAEHHYSVTIDNCYPVTNRAIQVALSTPSAQKIKNQNYGK